MWIISVLVLLSFLCRPSEEQTFPYVSIGGEVLPNYSFVNMSLVGTSIDSAVQCHTDLAICCSATQGSRRANWLSPGGNKLPFPTEHSISLFQNRDDRRVDLYRGSSAAMSGMYYCDIPTLSSSSNLLYIGLYMNGGKVMQLAYINQWIDIGKVENNTGAKKSSLHLVVRSNELKQNLALPTSCGQKLLRKCSHYSTTIYQTHTHDIILQKA